MTEVTASGALAAELAADPSRPMVTFYNESTSERVELSVKTTSNWVDKIANLLGADLMLDVGRRVRVELPVHWQSFVVALGVWRAGLVLVTEPGGDADLRVVGPDAVGSGPASGSEPGQLVLACSLLPLGGRFTTALPPGWLDFAAEVPPQPDVLLEPRPGIADAPAVDQLTHRQLASLAAATSADVGLRQGGRLGTDQDSRTAGGVALTVVGPLLAGASVVLVTGADGARRSAIAAQERVTAQAWSSR